MSQIAFSIDFFDGMKPPRQTGKEIGHAKAKQAADHAGTEWQDQAFAALCSFAKAHATFTVEAVRHANPGLVAPTDKAWGAVAIRARNAGLIAACGNAKTQGGRMLATLWEPCYFVVSGDADSKRLGGGA